MSYLEKHRDKIFKKYTREKLIEDITIFKNGKNDLKRTLDHFFEEIIYECKGIRGNLSPMEALQDDEIMEKILEFIESKPNFYFRKETTNVKTFFRNAGKWACKVSNFSPKKALEIYSRYGKVENKNILDTSCGFGSRMCASLLSNNNYFGFEPNLKLVNQLNYCYAFLKENSLTKNNAKVYSFGSEKFINELENTIDISFTSPPYFNIEWYSNDDGQSIKQFPVYSDWLEYFVKPTINNTYKYLKINGIAIINIKNLTIGKKEPLFDDWFKIFESIDGFEHVENFEMSHQRKKHYHEDSNNGFKEQVMVFKKIK